MADRTTSQILTDHGNRYDGGKRLVWSDLTTEEQANLSVANLSGANLTRADLSGANLSSGLRIVQGPARSDGYYFSLRVCCLGEHIVVAGCRNFTIEEYRQHVADSYAGEPKAAETLAILDFLEVRRDQIFSEWSGS